MVHFVFLLLLFHLHTPTADDSAVMFELATSLSPIPDGWSTSGYATNYCNWAGVQCDISNRVVTIDLSNSNLHGTLPTDLSTLSHLDALYLHRNNLSGALPSFANLSFLRILSLDNNNLTGLIPDSLTKLTRLEVVDVSNNNLSGKIPDFASYVKLISTPGNPFLNKAETAVSRFEDNHHALSSLIAGVVGGVVAFVAIAWFVVFKYNIRKRCRGPDRVNGEENANDMEKHYKSRFLGANSEFSLDLIRQITNDFNDENILGNGGFGIVYKGELPDRTMVAVKRLKATAMAGTNKMDEFQAEISVLAKVRHRHLVSLLGYCVQDNDRFLIYEYMPQGTLAQHLFKWRQHRNAPLTWKQRISIALDVAQGVEYLHNLADQSLSFIHRDLKPSNILLDNDMRAKVSDFGLVKKAPVGKSSFQTRVAGTFGYLAPEYAETGRVTRKVDVYAFGAILMEMITGRKAVDDAVDLEEEGWMSAHLVTWFHDVLKNDEISNAIDQSLNPDEDTMKSIREIAELAGHCTHQNPRRRPDISHAVNSLVPFVQQWKPPVATTLNKRSSSIGRLVTEEQNFIIDLSAEHVHKKHVTF